MSYVFLMYNFKATTVVNFIWISLGAFEIYCKREGVFFPNTAHNQRQVQWANALPKTILIHTFLSWFGNIQRTKFGLVLFKVCISLTSCSLYVWATVRNIPLRVRTPNMDSVPTVALMPTISATGTSIPDKHTVHEKESQWYITTVQ